MPRVGSRMGMARGEDEDGDWYYLGESPEEGEDAAKAVKKRRDSGGSK